MEYDFVEIGTSNFRTLIEKANDTTVGISVEPLAMYLNQLPNPKNVKKLNVAISFDNSNSEIIIFYIPENIILENNLPNYLQGCNSLLDFHPKHIELNVQEFVKKQTVQQIPISQLFEENNIEKLNLLKIDTEGGDCFILKHFSDYLVTKDKECYPKKIIFETNALTDPLIVKNTIEIFCNLGYRLGKKQNKTDTILVYAGNK